MHLIGGRRKASGTVTRTLVNGGAAAVCALVLAVSACASPPDSATPDATPTASAPPTGGVDVGDDVGDDAELFRAAEDTYRAYVDALNHVDLSDPSTFEPVYALTTGTIQSTLRDEFEQMKADGWTVGGATRIKAVVRGKRIDASKLELLVCADVSGVTLTDSDGRSRVSPERPDVHSLRITLVRSSDDWEIERIQAREGAPRCDV